MNLVMAQGARLEESLLAVKRRCARRSAGFPGGGRVGMALQAQQIDVAHSQHVRIGTSMGSMAGRAALDFYGLVLEHKRPLLVGVASEANRVLRR